MADTMTALEAKAYILAHDEEAKVLNRKSRRELAAIETSELAAHGLVRLAGNPGSKDELVNHITDMRFPRAAEARAVYYAAAAEQASAAMAEFADRGRLVVIDGPAR
jgi:hypothetical protein